jgi:hypothetical protein
MLLGRTIYSGEGFEHIDSVCNYDGNKGLRASSWSAGSMMPCDEIELRVPVMNKNGKTKTSKLLPGKANLNKQEQPAAARRVTVERIVGHNVRRFWSNQCRCCCRR